MTLEDARTAMAMQEHVRADNGPVSARLQGLLTKERRTAERMPAPGEDCGDYAGYEFRLTASDGDYRWLPAGVLHRI